MSVAVVDGFELVDVEHDERERTRPTLAVRLSAQALVEVAAVSQLGQPVTVAVPLQLVRLGGEAVVHGAELRERLREPLALLPFQLGLVPCLFEF